MLSIFLSEEDANQKWSLTATQNTRLEHVEQSWKAGKESVVQPWTWEDVLIAQRYQELFFPLLYVLFSKSTS